MYQRRSGGLTSFLVVIVLGLAAGVVYLAFDRSNFAAQSPIPPTATSEPTQAEATLETIASPTPAGVREITDGARFYAPTAGIAGEIVESYLDGTSWDVSQLGPNIGHLQGTAWIQDVGNVVLAGHVEMADGRKGIFADLNALQIGDPITVSQGDEEHTYQVTQKFSTMPDDMTVIYPSDNHRLTLITCAAYDFLSNSYEERFVVIAERVT